MEKAVCFRWHTVFSVPGTFGKDGWIKTGYCIRVKTKVSLVLHGTGETLVRISNRQGICQHKARIVLGEKPNAPLAVKGDEQPAPEILQQGRAGAQHELIRLAGAFLHKAQVVVGKTRHIEVHAVLIFHAVLEHVKLQRAHDADNNLLHTGVRHLEDLNGALLGNLLRALMNCLRFMVSLGATRMKCSGSKVGMPEYLNFFPGTEMVSPMEKRPGSNTPMMSPA